MSFSKNYSLYTVYHCLARQTLSGCSKFPHPSPRKLAGREVCGGIYIYGGGGKEHGILYFEILLILPCFAHPFGEGDHMTHCPPHPSLPLGSFIHPSHLPCIVALILWKTSPIPSGCEAGGATKVARHG